jgi:zinc/manganese transport system permease protein
MEATPRNGCRAKLKFWPLMESTAMRWTMADLLTLYGFTIFVGSLFCGCLAAMGSLVVSKSTAVQTLTAAQGATFGVVLGLALNLLLGSEAHERIYPTLLGISGCLGAYLISGFLSRSHSSPEAFFLTNFALLWSLSQLTIGLFPALEVHTQSLFFGDIVTLSSGFSWIILAYSVFLVMALCFRWRQWCDGAFAFAVLKREGYSQQWIASFVTLVAIALSIQFLGLLFSLSALFLPTVMLGRTPFSIRMHLFFCGLTGALAAGLGFYLSLWQPRLLTTPTIGLLLFLLPLAAVLALRIISFCKSIAFNQTKE